MSKMRIVLPFLSLLFLISFNSQAAKKSSRLPRHPSRIVYDSLDWEVPLGTPFRTVLKNGCIAYVATDSLLPLIKVTVYIRHGSLTDPAGKEGLSSLMARMLRTGGTEKFPADTLDALIDLLALKMSFSSTETQSRFSASFLSEYRDTAFMIMQEMFFHPVFNGKKLEKEKKIILESIKHRFDDPGPTLGAAFKKMMYTNQPSNRLSTAKSIKSITRKDLIALQKRIFAPDNFIFCISGPFNRDAMITHLESFFPVKMKDAKDIQFPKVSVNTSPATLLVHKEISQAYVRIGLPMFQRPHPDYYPMSVLNQILGGGGFTSRLGKSVRSDAGLTYSIHSSASSNYTYPSAFQIDFFTKNETFTKAVELTIKEVKHLVENGITEEELAHVKSTLINELPSMFRSADDIVSTYGWNEYYHRAPDHYRVYPDKIKAITRDDITKVANKYLTIDSMSVAVVGDTTVLLKQSGETFTLNKRKRTTLLPAALETLP